MGQGTLPPGSNFGRYHIIRLLGSGGMGHVYHAWDGELGEAVALKVIRGEYLTSPDAEARFKRELSISRQVTHKSVIRIYDLGDVDGVKFISMAFIDGVDLGSVIKMHGRRSNRRSTSPSNYAPAWRRRIRPEWSTAT